jgi:hypothetical protein
MNAQEQEAVRELTRIAEHDKNARILDNLNVLRQGILRRESEGVRHKDLGFLTGCSWLSVRIAETQADLRPVLRPLDDDKLMEAFHVVFVNDFALERIDSNRWRLTWDEYQDDVAQQGYKGIPEGEYDGDQLIDFMLNNFETPGHFCLLYNTYMERPQNKAIFPRRHQDREVFIQCGFRGVG